MANTRKLHYKDINATASTYTGDLGNIWFDPETNVLRTYTGSPGGKLIGDGTVSSLVNGASNVSISTANGVPTIARAPYFIGPSSYPARTWTFGSGPIGSALAIPGFVQGPSQTGLISADNYGLVIDSANTPASISLGLQDGNANLTKFFWGSGSKNGIAGDVEIQTIPVGGTPTSIILSPQGGQNGSFIFGGTGTLTLPNGLQTSSSETLNLFTNYSSGNINIGGISPTINMGGGQVNIGYLNTRIVFGYSGVLTAGTSFTNFTGTPASNGMWTTAIATGTNGNGGPQNGVPVSFTVHGAFGVYNSVGLNFYGQGQNYAVGDTITIAGTQLGGTSPANDLTFTIAGEVGNTYPNLGPGSLVFDYGLGQFFGYTQNTYGTQSYPLWRRLDNTSASSLVNGSYTVSLGTAGTLNLPNFGSTPGAGDGSIGDIARHSDILYFKTSTGWKTVTLGV